MKTWTEFYSSRMTQLYRKNLKRKYQPFLDLILAKNPSNLVELGCGPGNITRLLLNELPNSRFTCVDRSSSMLAICENNIKESRARERVRLKQDDITTGRIRATQPTLIHSHGVLEHLNDREITSLLRPFILSPSPMVHCVPSKKYGSKSYGDERLMSADRWKEICNPSRIVEFNQGFDLALIWE